MPVREVQKVDPRLDDFGVTDRNLNSSVEPPAQTKLPVFREATSEVSTACGSPHLPGTGSPNASLTSGRTTLITGIAPNR